MIRKYSIYHLKLYFFLYIRLNHLNKLTAMFNPLKIYHHRLVLLEGLTEVRNYFPAPSIYTRAGGSTVHVQETPCWYRFWGKRAGIDAYTGEGLVQVKEGNGNKRTVWYRYRRQGSRLVKNIGGKGDRSQEVKWIGVWIQKARHPGRKLFLL